MKTLINRYPILLLVIIGLGLYGLNLVDLKVSIMEARNFIVAREMLTENHWFLTTMNDLARYEKPPFPAWFTTPFVYVFGLDNVWAYRIPTSIFSTLGLVYFFKLIKLWLPKDLAFYSALVLGTSFYYIAIRFEAPSDIYTHVNMIIGIYFLVRRHPRIYLKNMILGSLFLGFSILSKGPVSPYALLLPFLLAYFVCFKFDVKSHLFKLFGFLILGFVVGGSWYLYVRYADPQTLLEIADKETDNWTSYNTRPFYYYWSFFIQTGIWTIPAALSLMYPYFINRIKHQRLYKFSFLWTLLALVLLSVIPEKKPRYLVPVLFPLALNTVLVINYLVNHKTNRFSKLFHYLHYPIIILLCMAVIISPFMLNILWSDFWFFYVLLSLCSLSIAFFTLRYLKHSNFKTLFFMNILLVLMLTSLAQSQVQVLKANDDYHSLSRLHPDNKNFNIYYYRGLSPEIVWTYGEISTPFNSESNLEEPYRILVSANHIEDFRAKYPELHTKQRPQVYDENYFKSGDRKRKRLVIYVFDIEVN